MAKTTRRQALLAGAGLLGSRVLSAPLRALPFAQSSPRERILVMVQMYGGNDSLNTIVPFTDAAYRSARPTLGIAAEDVLPIDDRYGFHPALSGIDRIWKSGQMAVINGIGYPDPILSHFGSMDIWNHGARDELDSKAGGWIGRLNERVWKQESKPETVIHVGSHPPFSIFSRSHPSTTFEFPENYIWVGNQSARSHYGEIAERVLDPEQPQSPREKKREALQRSLRASWANSPRVLRTVADYAPTAQFATETFSNNMKTLAAFIAAKFDTRVYSVSIGNFDQHGLLRHSHDPLLGEFDRGISSFLNDVQATRPDADVLVATYSEFGRRLAQNASAGTDHGAAGSAYLFGSLVKGGFYSDHPSLTDLDENGNLRYSIDFRSMYSTIIADWFDADPKAVIKGDWQSIPCLRT